MRICGSSLVSAKTTSLPVDLGSKPNLPLHDLSCAKIACATMSLRCNAFVTVMKTAELRYCDDPAATGDRPREWALLCPAPNGSGNHCGPQKSTYAANSAVWNLASTNVT